MHFVGIEATEAGCQSSSPGINKAPGGQPKAVGSGHVNLTTHFGCVTDRLCADPDLTL
jgi:hypothetical protein